jgi:hypothetical protein
MVDSVETPTQDCRRVDDAKPFKGEEKMRKVVMMISSIVGLAAVAIMLAAPVQAQKGQGAQSGGYTCKSGHRVKNLKACKENGGNL